MSRKRSRSGSIHRAPRDVSHVASPVDLVDLFRLRPLSTHPRSGQDLRLVEDRRTFSPVRVAPSRTPRQVARVLMAAPSSRSSSLGKQVLVFRIPKSTAVCVRRSVRKEVIHALGRAGTKVRRPKRNAMSSISCRRK